ncbi:nucleolar protein,Nop52-domain-containing protein [Coniella lustricola]|uniref:Nucleolar protein,Nop52-domain-containing protein n=1 Tax=Coniella lustricola TaxID=2025994 RepID=A0A2T3A0B1_9PEZI|nr:nucleolar protein,Nop52-domain-containing protein [Coniella lustricola]
MASQQKSMPFIKNMASSNRKLREQSLASLRTFLSAKHISSALSTLDILKLWKGLFYALWMCDRPLPQQQLCADLSALIWILPRGDGNAAVVSWLRGFWATMAREWTTGIDVLRMEKFLLLVRRMLGVSFNTTKKNNNSSSNKTKKEDAEAAPRFNAERTEQVLQLLADWPFRAEEESRREEDEEGLMPKLVPVGLKLHVLDIWIDEAEKAGMLLSTTTTKATTSQGTLSGRQVLRRINDLVESMRAETRSTQVRIRSKDALADDRLPWNETQEEESEDGDEDVWRGLGD